MIENPYAALIAFLPLLAFLEIRRVPRHQTVAGLLYFRDLPSRRVLPRLRFRRDPRRWPTAILLAVAVVLALGPMIPQGDRRVLLALDDSARMQARLADGRTRFEAARQALYDYGAERIRDSEVYVLPVSASQPAQPVLTERELADALGGISVKTTGLHLETALTSLRAWAASRSVGTVAVATDRPANLRGDDVVWFDVAEGEQPHNLAITAVHSPTRLFGDVRKISIQVQNFGPETVKGVELRAMQPGDTAETVLGEPLELEANVNRTIPVEQLARRHGIVPPFRVALYHRGDVLDLDNSLWILPDRRPRFRVLFACGASGAMWRWLLPHPLIDFSSDDAAMPNAIDEASSDAVVYDSCETDPPPVPGAHRLVFSPAKGGAAMNFVNERIVTQQVAWYENELLDGIRPLFGLRMHRANLLSDLQFEGSEATSSHVLFGDPSNVVRSSDGDFLRAGMAMSAQVGGNKLLYLGFDPHVYCDASTENPVGFRQDDCMSMLFLTMNAFDWMYGSSPSPYRPTGTIYRGRGQGEERMRDPGGNPLPKLGGGMAPAEGNSRFVLNEPGRYDYSSSTEWTALSVGLLDPEESSLSRQPIDVPATGLPSGVGVPGRPAWREVLWLLWLVFAVEAALLFSRRRGARSGVAG